MTKPKAVDYTSSLVLADYYLDLGLDRISDQIRYRNKPPFSDWLILRVRISRSGGKSISLCGYGEVLCLSTKSWCSTRVGTRFNSNSCSSGLM